MTLSCMMLFKGGCKIMLIIMKNYTFLKVTCRKYKELGSIRATAAHFDISLHLTKQIILNIPLKCHKTKYGPKNYINKKNS